MEHIYQWQRPALYEARMVMGFTGWMDGGRISTGTIEYLANACAAEKFAEIDPTEFYVHHFPIATLPITIVVEGEESTVRSASPMEQAAIFRPHAEIRDGIVQSLAFARNDLLASEDHNLILFSGEEPHIRWRTYANELFAIAEEFGVRQIYFVGSVASPIPHTREPRVRLGVSTEALKDKFQHPEIGYSEYEGPASLITFMMTQAAAREIEMCSAVVEVPHYPFLEIPAYPHSILRVLTVLLPWLGLDLDLSDLRQASEAVRQQLDRLQEQHDEFRDLVTRLEDSYDVEASPADEQVLKRLIDEIDFGGDKGEA